MPKVSVIIPTYNREEYIASAVDSVLSQTFRDFEVIVVDDGSTDNTRQILDEYGGKIRYVYQENSERAVARNLGIQLSEGQYIAFLDSDDLCMPERLGKQAEALDSQPDAGMVYSNALYIDDDENIVSDVSAYTKRSSGSVFSYFALAERIPSPSKVMVRKSCFEKVGDFNHATIPAEDWDMWLRIAKHYKAIHIAEPLAKYRTHSLEAEGRQTESMLKAKLKVMKMHLSKDALSALPDDRDSLLSAHKRAVDNIISEAVSGVYQVYLSGNMFQTRRIIATMMIEKPSLIANKLVMSVFFKSLLGRGLSNWIRRKKYSGNRAQ